MSELVINIVIWAAQIFYLVSFFPQIFTNYTLQTGAGLSDVLLFGYLNGYLAFFYYLYCFKFTFFDELITVLQFIALLVLVFQRFYYSSAMSSMRFFMWFFADILFVTVFIPFAYKHPQVAGNIGGWVAAIFFCLSQLFQMFKIHMTKSVAGFSILFVFLILLGSVLELTVSYILQYPMQTRLALWRLVVGCGIYCVQFYLYKR